MKSVLLVKNVYFNALCLTFLHKSKKGLKQVICCFVSDFFDFPTDCLTETDESFVDVLYIYCGSTDVLAVRDASWPSPHQHCSFPAAQEKSRFGSSSFFLFPSSSEYDRNTRLNISKRHWKVRLLQVQPTCFYECDTYLNGQHPNISSLIQCPYRKCSLCFLRGSRTASVLRPIDKLILLPKKNPLMFFRDLFFSARLKKKKKKRLAFS